MLKTYNFNGTEVVACAANYENNGNLAVLLYEKESGEMYGCVSVNLDFLMPGFAFVDTNNMGEEIVPFLKENKIAKPTGRYRDSGFCRFQLWEFNMNKLTPIKKYVDSLR